MPVGDQAHGLVVVLVDVLERDDVTLHADHLGHVADAAGAVAEAVDVDDEVERRGDLLADGPRRQVEAGHQHHRLHPGQGVARGVGVHRRQRAVVAGVHRLEHVEGLGAADLTDDDAVGAHAQRVAHEIANGDLSVAFDVGRASLEADHVLLVQLQLDGILDGDDALVRAERSSTAR